MIGLNLLPDVKKEFIKAQRTRNTVISLSILTMAAVGGATIVLALFVYVAQSAMINLKKDEITKRQSTLAAKPEVGKYLTIQNQLDALKGLHDADHKILYSRLFDYLPQLNPAPPHNVKIGSIKVSKKDTSMDIQGNATDFKGMDTFKNTLENATISYKNGETSSELKLFPQVSIKSAALSSENNIAYVSFEFSVTYSKEAFSPDATEVKLNVPKLTISDSKTNAPSEIFKDNGGSN